MFDSDLSYRNHVSQTPRSCFLSFANSVPLSSQEKNGLSVADFFCDFSNILDSYSTLSDELVIAGDFNFHLDDPNNIHSRRLLELLKCHGMVQHVTEPTHKDGHLLDLIITREQTCVTDVVISDMIADHNAVHWNINVLKPPCTRELRTYRKIKAIDPMAFSEDICKSEVWQHPDTSLDGLIRQYNNVLSTLLDKHAPVKTKLLTVRPAAPWIGDSVISARKIRRQSEQRWRKKRLEIYRDIYEYQREKVKKMINTARAVYYAD